MDKREDWELINFFNVIVNMGKWLIILIWNFFIFRIFVNCFNFFVIILKLGFWLVLNVINFFIFFNCCNSFLNFGDIDFFFLI